MIYAKYWVNKIEEHMRLSDKNMKGFKNVKALGRSQCQIVNENQYLDEGSCGDADYKIEYYKKR